MIHAIWTLCGRCSDWMTHCVTRQVSPSPPPPLVPEGTLAAHANLLAGQQEKAGLVSDAVQDCYAKLA